MYCKKCGKELNEDSKFCDNCGSKIVKKIKSDDCRNENAENNKKKSFVKIIKKKAVLALIIILCTFIGVKIIEKNNLAQDDTSSLLERELIYSDYTYSAILIAKKISVTIVPNVNVRTCSVELTVYDDNYNRIFEDTQTKDDLKKDASYVYTFSVDPVDDITKIDSNKIRLFVLGSVIKDDYQEDDKENVETGGVIRPQNQIKQIESNKIFDAKEFMEVFKNAVREKSTYFKTIIMVAGISLAALTCFSIANELYKENKSTKKHKD